jgi:hypothetical protein
MSEKELRKEGGVDENKERDIEGKVRTSRRDPKEIEREQSDAEMSE